VICLKKKRKSESDVQKHRKGLVNLHG